MVKFYPGNFGCDCSRTEKESGLVSKVKKVLFIFTLIILNSACQTLMSETRDDSEAFHNSPACCANWLADGKCAHKIEQGCVNSSDINKLRNNKKTDNCCAHWLSNGKCAHELKPGCSTR